MLAVTATAEQPAFAVSDRHTKALMVPVTPERGQTARAITKATDASANPMAMSRAPVNVLAEIRGPATGI
jgi:hypothetical protein